MLPNIKPAPKQPSSSHPSPIFPHHHKHCQTFFISHASPWHPPPCDVQLRINHFPPFLKLHKLIEMKFIVDQKFIFRWLLLTSFTFAANLATKWCHSILYHKPCTVMILEDTVPMCKGNLLLLWFDVCWLVGWLWGDIGEYHNILPQYPVLYTAPVDNRVCLFDFLLISNSPPRKHVTAPLWRLFVWKWVLWSLTKRK